MKPANSDGRQARKIAAQHKPAGQQRGLDRQPHRHREGGGHDEIRIVQAEDRAAVADRREREARAGREPERRRHHVAAQRSGFERHHHHAGGRQQDGERHRRRDVVAEEHEPEQRHLDRLGLDVGDRHHERALAHRGQHQGGGRDLQERAGQHPRPKNEAGPRQRRAADGDDAGEKQARERQAEQEPHMRRADRAEPAGELALGRVAHGLRRRRDQGEDGPQPGRCSHAARSAVTM
jgi:hypothetical protein